MPSGGSMLPRPVKALSRSRNRAPQGADETFALGELARQADFTLLANDVPDWLQDDSFVGGKTSVEAQRPREDSPGELEASRLDSLRTRTNVSLDPPEEDKSEEDEVLAQYRQEPSCDASQILQELKRQKSMDGRAPFAMSTPAPARAHFKPPAPMTATNSAAEQEQAPTPRMPLRSASGPATMQPAVFAENLEQPDRDESPQSIKISQSFLKLEPSEDDMFERKKRDANRMSGISFEEVILPAGNLGMKRRATVKLPSRPKRTPRKEDARAIASTLTIASTAQETAHESAPAFPLAASVPGLTMPREFTFTMRPPLQEGLSARARSATRVAEQAAARTQRSVSAAFAGPTSRPQSKTGLHAARESLRGGSGAHSALGLGRPAFVESTNIRSATAPAAIRKPGRASLAQTMPAPKPTVAAPFVFFSDLRHDRPRQTEAVLMPPPAVPEGKRKRPLDDQTTRVTTEVKAFAFSTEKRRRT